MSNQHHQQESSQQAQRFAGLQRFFKAVHDLTSERRLSRILYLVEKTGPRAFEEPQ